MSDPTGMPRRELGRTGVELPAIGLGCMGMVGWYGERDDAEALATLDRALELGVNHLDTAAVYQNGDNERFLGGWLRGRREQVFLATKCGMVRSPDGRPGVDGRAATIRQSCDDSLARLGIDHIDLFYLHRVDRTVPIEESMAAMAALVRAGKVRHVGLSEASPATLQRAHRVHPVAALQSELSLWTQASARPSLAVCAALGITFVAYSPLGRGFLTGAIRSPADLTAQDTRRLFPRFDPSHFGQNLAAAAVVAELATRFGCTAGQLALAWVLAQGERVVAIPGTKKRRYLEENAAAAALCLTAAQLAEIDGRLAELPVAGDRYPDSMMAALGG
jgi:aryl-alcohol dehydrogenase-like predicted oxidoreductase